MRDETTKEKSKQKYEALDVMLGRATEDSTMDKPYNRVSPSDPQHEKAQYFIICAGGGGTLLATRDAFLTYEDAKHLCDTIHSCYKARVVKVCEEQKEKSE